jgi:hypothetical protein
VCLRNGYFLVLVAELLFTRSDFVHISNINLGDLMSKRGTALLTTPRLGHGHGHGHGKSCLHGSIVAAEKVHPTGGTIPNKNSEISLARRNRFSVCWIDSEPLFMFPRTLASMFECTALC